MSRRKPPTFGDLAGNAAGGRRVVVSAGTLDGALLLALQRLQLAAGAAVPPSTWGEGVTLGDQVNGGDDGKGSHS